MKKKPLLLLLLIILAMVLIGLGIGMLGAIISMKVSSNVVWAGVAVLVVLSLIYLQRDANQARKKLAAKREEYLTIGTILFAHYSAVFEVYYNEYLQTKHSELDFVAALYAFAYEKQLGMNVDWRGEDEGEIEAYVRLQIATPVTWTNSAKLYDEYQGKDTSDGNFILHLFKAIDQDLAVINKKLLFFELGNDSYNFTITDVATFNAVMVIDKENMFGTEKL